MSAHRMRLEDDGFSNRKIWLDGQPVENAVKSLRIVIEAGEYTSIELELSLVPLQGDLVLNGHVDIDQDSRDLLRALGWKEPQ